MNNYLFWVIQIITTTFLGLIAWFLKEFKKSMFSQIEKNSDRTKALEEEMKKLPEKYVLKSDWQLTIRNIERQFSSIDGKLDKIGDKITNIIKKI